MHALFTSKMYGGALTSDDIEQVLEKKKYAVSASGA